MLKNIGNDEGIRENMRMSYEKHRRMAEAGTIDVDERPHCVGLYGALATRNRLTGRPSAEAAVWVEIFPFMHLPDPEGIEAVAEYAVALEKPARARFDRLVGLIRKGFTSAPTEDQEVFIVAARMNGTPWLSWIED